MAAADRWGNEIDNHMFKTVKWMQRRVHKRPGGVPTSSDARSAAAVLAKWTVLGKAVAALAGMPGGGEMVNVLNAAVGVEDAQSRTLRSIDTNVKLLVSGPYRAGRTRLQEAQRVGISDASYREFLEGAKERFYDAHGQAPSVQARSMIEYHLGVTWLLLGSTKDALYWFSQSHTTAVSVIDKLVHQSRNIRVLNSQGATVALSYFYYVGVFVAAAKFRRVWDAELAREALAEYIPFVGCVAQSYNSLVDDQELPAFEIMTRGDEGFDLVIVD
jgi:hypothetical protein